jgi:hypothetical protein
VDGNAGVETDVKKNSRQNRFGALENEAQHLGLEKRGSREPQDRGDEGDVKGHEDVVCDHPPFLEVRGGGRSGLSRSFGREHRISPLQICKALGVGPEEGKQLRQLH